MVIELLIQWGSDCFAPVVKDSITWTLERKGTPGKLEFTVIKDDVLKFEEGAAVRLRVDEKNVFYGFVFKKSYDKDKNIKVTAYDQLRYLKNKDTYVYTNKTATELVQMIANDFNLNLGQMDDTYHKIASKVEDNQTLFDIIQNALDDTLMNRNEIYVLYDDFGKLRLSYVKFLSVGLVIDAETAETFDYSSSIDGETYNRIKLVRENEDTGKRDVYIAQSGENMNNWGVLQYFDTVDENENAQAKADSLLKLYNQKTKGLKINGVLGDLRVRAGSLVIVQLDLDDTKVNNFMLVEKVTHSFENNHHSMDLTLKGAGMFDG
ncbi:XkdQ/YqbQ family protein [Thomasclavelia spiroformis]|uniref:XkdQ/YqbQ family protein n=1 Tax=Thomasclavelia spiroformis TaxID=29348 RepID=UPI003208D69F